MGVVLALPEEEEKRSQSHDRGVGAAVVVPDCSEWVGKVVGSRMSAPMVENGNTSGDGRPPAKLMIPGLPQYFCSPFNGETGRALEKSERWWVKSMDSGSFSCNADMVEVQR